MPPWNSHLNANPLPWLLDQDAPWIRYRTLLDLQDKSEDDPNVVTAREEMIEHHKIKELIEQASRWPSHALTRHNDATHIIHKLTVLADFGLTKDDPGMSTIIGNILAHQSPEGAFQSLLQVPKAYGGSGEEELSWMSCDAPIVLHAISRFSFKDHPTLAEASNHLASLIRESGWPCAVAPEFGNFKGPGRKDDPCPYANLISVKALRAGAGHNNQEAMNIGVEMLLTLWERQRERKIYMFGIGTTFRRVKYPFIWYDILHVLETLSRLPSTHSDPRFKEMVQVLIKAQDENGRFRAGSIWLAWKDWGFGQKREPSPWITMLALRILKRVYP